MSLAQAKKVVSDFLLDEGSEVLSIKGGWGVGKTYFWNACIKELGPKDNFCRKQYAYVSLFGISSLEQLKSAIFESTVDKSQIGNRISIENFKQNADKLTVQLGRKAAPIISALAKNFGSIIQSVTFAFVNETLVCLDDFERKGDSLSTKDILGLVSLLKDQHGCKVALIFSDTNLDEQSGENYKQFREKVVDLEVSFSPTAEESATLVFSEKADVEKGLSKFTIKLGIANIRILNRIKRAVFHAAELLEKENYEPEVTQQALQSLTLFGWCYYSHDKIIPPYEYVKRTGLPHLDFKEKTNEEKGWDAVLRKYEYGITDEFDLALSSLIENGFADEVLLLEEAAKVNQQVIVRKLQDSFGEVWSFCYGSFADNEDEVVRALCTRLKSSARYTSPADLNATVVLLRDLGKNELATELIDFYIIQNKTDKKIFDIPNRPFPDRITDAEVLSKFSKIFSEMQGIKTFGDALNEIAQQKGWNISHEEILASATEDDFYNVFMATTGEVLDSYIESCLRFERFSNSTDRQHGITEQAKKALFRIASKSKLNKIRIARYGVKIE